MAIGPSTLWCVVGSSVSLCVCGIAAQVVWTTMSGRWPALPVVGLPWSGVVGGVGSTAAPLVLDGAPAVDAVCWWGGVCVCAHVSKLT